MYRTAGSRTGPLASSQASRTFSFIEDDDVLRRLLVTTLEQEGYKVRAEADGTRLDVIGERFQPDLVGLEMRLPVGPDGSRSLGARPATSR